MNDFDRENVNFLLNASKEDMEDWHLHATDDDYAYAHELIQRRHTELTMHELALIDSEVELMAEDQDLPEAQDLLAKFASK